MAKTMDKEFVKYEQSLALKELGFNKPCLAYWNYHTQELNYNSHPSTFHSEDVIQLPLKQQVFRWFQNKYKWYHTMDFCRKVYPSTNQYKWKIDIGLGDVFFIGWADTYEEAENAAIDKLIEIAKQQAIS
jgi:hypothetical protein